MAPTRSSRYGEPPRKMRKTTKAAYSDFAEVHKKAMTSGSPLAQYNSRVLKALEQSFTDDAEFDLLAAISPTYKAEAEQMKMKALKKGEEDPIIKDLLRPISDESINSGPSNSINSLGLLTQHLPSNWSDERLTIVEPLADSVVNALHLASGSDLSIVQMVRVLDECEVVSGAASNGTSLVLGLGPDTIVKLDGEPNGRRECAALNYVQQHCPALLTPKSLGMVILGKQSVHFMTRLRGITLENIWASLDKSEKESASQQVGALLVILREHTPSPSLPWGSLDGSGCLDRRMYPRQDSHIIRDSSRFLDFYFSNPMYGREMWTSLLRDLCDSSLQESRPDGAGLLTHGDLHPSNIMVERVLNTSTIRVTGFIDWECCGIYPAYWETLKMTSCLGPFETSDWYRHLPPPVAIEHFAVPWLVDLVWDKQIVPSKSVLGS